MWVGFDSKESFPPKKYRVLKLFIMSLDQRFPFEIFNLTEVLELRNNISISRKLIEFSVPESRKGLKNSCLPSKKATEKGLPTMER